MGADFQLIRQTTIFLLEPLTEAARAWAEDHVPVDATHFGPAIVIEQHHIVDILMGICTAGLTVDRVSP